MKGNWCKKKNKQLPNSSVENLLAGGLRVTRFDQDQPDDQITETSEILSTREAFGPEPVTRSMSFGFFFRVLNDVAAACDARFFEAK